MSELAPLSPHLGLLLKRERRRQRKTQEWLADEIGVALRTVQKYESDGRIPDDKAEAAATALGVRIETLTPESVTESEFVLTRLADPDHTVVDLGDGVLDFGRELTDITDPIARARVIAAARYAALKEIDEIMRRQG